MKKRIGLGRAKLEADAQRLMDIISGTEQSQNLMIFKMGDQSFALPLEQVLRALRANQHKIHKRDSAISLIRGYIQINKKAIPVISLHTYLGMEKVSDYDIWTSILICQTENFRFGLLSENVLQVSPILKGDANTLIPERLLLKYQKIIDGALAWNNETVIILNFKELFSAEDIRILTEEIKSIQDNME